MLIGPNRAVCYYSFRIISQNNVTQISFEMALNMKPLDLFHSIHKKNNLHNILVSLNVFKVSLEVLYSKISILCVFSVEKI